MRTEGLDDGVEKIGVGELGLLAGALAGYREKACGERLVPFDGERGDVANDAGEGVERGVARKRNCVEAVAADGRVAEERVERNRAGVPALGKNRVFKNGQHQAGVTGAPETDFLKSGSDGGGGGESTARAEGLLRKALDGRADGIVLGRGRRQIEAEVGPAALAVHAAGERFHLGCLLEEQIDQTAPGGGEIGGILESGGDGAGRLEADGKLMAGAGEISSGEEGSVRRNIGESREMKITFAVGRGVRKFFDNAGGGLNGGPVHAGIIGDINGAVECFRVLEDVREEIGLGIAIVVGKISRTNGDDDVFLLSEAIEILEELDGLLARKAFGVFGERLSGDAQGLNGLITRLKGGFGELEELYGFGDLKLVAPAIENDKGGNGADPGPGRFGGFFLGVGRGN